MEELEKYCVFIRNGTNIKNNKEQSGVPITRIETISDGTIDKEKMGYADIFDDRYKDYYLQKDDILMSHINSMRHLGKVAYCNINMDVIHGMNLLNIRADSSKIYPKYLYYYFKSNDFKIKLNRISKQSVNQSSFAVTDLKKIKIKITDKITQKEIVYKLDKIEDVISLRKNQIKLFENIIKSQFVEMFENEKYPKDEFINLSKEIYAGGDKPKDISRIKTKEYLYPVFANGCENEGLQGYSKNYRTKDESVTISARGTIGYSSIREGKFTPIVRLITITPNERVNVIYLKYAIDNINIAGSGTSQAQLTVPNVKKQKIIVPPIELQNKFAEIVKQIDKQKFEIQKSLEEIQRLQESLMNKYFG